MNVPRSIVAALACAASLVFVPSGADAQERIRIEGWVQWIAGNRMQLMTYSDSVAVDLKEADQSAYRALRERDRVVVDGVVSTDRRRVIAHQLWRIDGGTEAP